MSLMTIAARFTDQPMKFADAGQPKFLTTLKMTYEGGSADGKTENFPTRDLSCVTLGRHRGNCHFFETYKRTIWINLRNQRTIFRCVGHTVKSNHTSQWKSLLANLHIRKLKVIVV
jgi:hypothetical protein